MHVLFFALLSIDGLSYLVMVSTFGSRAMHLASRAGILFAGDLWILLNFKLLLFGVQL